MDAINHNPAPDARGDYFPPAATGVPDAAAAPLDMIKPAAQGLAAPTLWFFAGLVAIVAVASIAAIGGRIPLWLGGIINLVVFYVSGHVQHESLHRNICGTDGRFAFLNEVPGNIVGCALFLPLPLFRGVHLAHHRFTNHPTLDSDMWFARKTAWGVFLACATPLIGYQRMGQRLVKRGLMAQRVLTETILWRVFCFALVGAAVMAGFGGEVLALWIVPGLLMTPISAYVFAYSVHHPHTSQEPMKTTRVLTGKTPLMARLVTFFMVFQNYHLVHHLYPRVPFYKCGAVFRANRAALQGRGATVKELG